MVCKGGRARQAVYMEQWLKTASQGSHVVLAPWKIKFTWFSPFGKSKSSRLQLTLTKAQDSNFFLNIGLQLDSTQTALCEELKTGWYFRLGRFENGGEKNDAR